MFEKWRFEKLRGDRRIGYSFRGHVRRVVEAKGFAQVALTLGATAIIAGTAFANCGGNSITGPSNDVAASPTKPTAPQLQTAKEGPMKLPFIALPAASPCTQEPIVWDNGSTMMQATTQISSDPLAGRLHIQFHLNAQGQGVSATRRYSGSQEYNSQLMTVAIGSQDRYKFEWNVKMIAKGEDGRLVPEDDFFLHVVETFGPQPDFMPGVPEALALPGECR